MHHHPHRHRCVQIPVTANGGDRLVVSNALAGALPFLAPPTVVGTDTEFTLTPPIFLPSIFLPLEAKWGQARNSEPVEIRSSDRRYRNRSDIGGRIDAPGDGRAPGAIACSNAPGQPRGDLSPPHFSAIHFSAIAFFASFSFFSAITKKSFVGSLG
jgi:hypothetical protein